MSLPRSFPVRRRAVLGAAVASYTLVACGGGPSQVTPMTAPPPGVIVDLQESTYTVQGADAATLRRQLDARSPGSWGRSMPVWDRPAGASEQLVADWTAFERGLRVHEEGHRDLALRAAADMRRRFRDLRTPNCAFIQREVRDLRDRVLEQWRERTREYDEETRHGGTQGAMWPPSAGDRGIGGT